MGVEEMGGWVLRRWADGWVLKRWVGVEKMGGC